MAHYTGSISATGLQFQARNGTVVHTSVTTGAANGGHARHFVGVDGVARGITFGNGSSVHTTDTTPGSAGSARSKNSVVGNVTVADKALVVVATNKSVVAARTAQFGLGDVQMLDGAFVQVAEQAAAVSIGGQLQARDGFGIAIEMAVEGLAILVQADGGPVALVAEIYIHQQFEV